MAAKFNEIYMDGRVFRRSTDTKSGADGAEPHMGAYDRQTRHIHFDPTFLDRAASGDAFWERDLANDALHEAAHALGFNHGEPFNTPVGPVYADYPFNLLSPGDNSCLLW